MRQLTGNKDQDLGSICNFRQVNQVKYEKFTCATKSVAPKRLKPLYKHL